MITTQGVSSATRSAVDELELTLPVDLTNIMGEWNGDEAGDLEERANIAAEAQAHWKALLECLEELE